jgi:hypothetical protein
MRVAHELKIAELKLVVDAIFAHITNDLRIDAVTVPDENDYYWSIPLDAPLDLKNPVMPEPDVGRLSDDWEFLASILKDKVNAVSLMLIHVAPLLRFIGVKVGQ